MSDLQTIPSQTEGTSTTGATDTQHARIPITFETMWNVRFPADVQLSPDGKYVAFVVFEPVAEQPKKQGRIWVAATSGGDVKPLTKGPKAALCPRWSPDSQRIAFITIGEDEKEKPQLHIISAQGGEAKRVCVMPNGVSDLAWSPDGSRIAFLSLEGEEPKTDPKVITPDRHRRLWTVYPDYDIPEPVTSTGLTVWEHAWSPDSQHLAVYYTTGSGETDWYRGQIGIVSAHGGAVRQISALGPPVGSLTWSPDGQRVAYVSGEWSDRGLLGGDIFELSIAGGEPRNLTPKAPKSFSCCRWFPDGRRLLYAAWQGVTHQLGILDTVDGSMKSLADDLVMGELFGPRFSVTPDMRCFAATHSTWQWPYDVWFGELTSEGERDTATRMTWRQLSRLNRLTEETVALSPTEHIRYESVDGWQIDALFTPPLKSKGDGPPPLVVDVHGGPTWAYVKNWRGQTQLLAAQGYAVLQPNIRGSLGHGAAFTEAVVGDMGGKDLQDILYGVDYLVSRGVVDGTKVAIMGGSYGGFMAAWAVTQTTRFKAGIMIAGLSDLHSFHAQTNIADWDMRFIGADPLERPEVYRERSAITYAKRVTTPTLIIHGEEDQCVPVNQAYAFYRALRERKVPVELVVYPREGHGLSEGEHVKDFQERMLRWFRQYL